MSDWTVDTLKEHMDAELMAVRRAVDLASTVAKERADKLETTSKEKFESTNEFRQQQTDLQAGFMPRGEAQAALKSMEEKMAAGFKTMEEKIAAKNVQIVSSLGVGFVGLMIAVFNLASRF